MGVGDSLLGELSARIGLDLTELKAKAAEAKAEFAEIDKSAETHAAKTGASLKTAGVAMAAVAVVVGFEAVNAAEKEEDAHARLVTALKNTGHGFDEFKLQIEEQEKSFQKLGVTSAEYEDALAKMSKFVHEPEEAMKDLTIANDVAAGSHLGLEDAVQKVGLAADGNVGKLKMLGINLDLTAGNAKSLGTAQAGLSKAQETLAATTEKVHNGQLKGPAAAAAMTKAQDGVKAAQEKLNHASDAGVVATQALADLYGGQAQAQAETFAGKQRKLHAQTEDLAAKLGERLIPQLIKLIDWLNKTAENFEAGCVIMGAGFVVIRAKWDEWYSTFDAGRKQLQAGWSELTGDFNRGCAQLKLGFEIIGGAWTLLSTDFKAGKKVIADEWNTLRTDFDNGVKVIKEKWNEFTGSLGAGATVLKNGLSGMWGGLRGGFESEVNWIIDKWNEFAKTMSVHIPGTNQDISIPQVNHVKFHQGGLVPGVPGQETQAILTAGERVVPVSMADRGGATVHTELHIHGSVGDEALLAKIEKALRKRDKQLVTMLRAGVGAK
jgi:hypothetical protein